MSKAVERRAGKSSENVRVAVRCRPLNAAETARGDAEAVRVDHEHGSVEVLRGDAADSRESRWTFDHSYGPESGQQAIFTQTAAPIVQSVIQGYNGTIFACHSSSNTDGQTGTGKTHTMEGVAEDEELRGLIPNSFHCIFAQLSSAAADSQFLVRCSFLEVYLDDVFDLLSSAGRQRMEVKESRDKGVFVKGLTEHQVQSVSGMLAVLRQGTKQRRTGATKMNEGSSRSHSILTVTVEASEAAAGGKTAYRVGKLNLVDLAGSERQKKTEAVGERLDEAKSINWSLTVLGNCIKALIEPNAKHVPYRDSKLTRLLQDSLGGNTKTVMIANVGPSSVNVDETVATLRYADRAKQIQNRPKVNEDPKDTMLKQFQDEIAELRRQLEEEAQGGPAAAAPRPLESGSGADADGEDEEGSRVVLENGEVLARGSGGRIIRTRLVERVVQVGVSEEEVQRLKAEAEAKRLQLEAEHAAETELMQQTHKQWEEKQADAAQQLSAKAAIIADSQAARLQLKQQLQQVESRLTAGQAIVSRSRKQEAALEKRKAALLRQQEEKARMESELRERESGQLELAGRFESLAQELQAANSKWEKLVAKYRAAKDDAQQRQLRQQAEREELLTQCRQSEQSIALQRAIQRAFIPRQEVAAVSRGLRGDDDAQAGPASSSPPAAAASRPGSVRGLERGLSVWSRAALTALQRPPVSDWTLQRQLAAQDADEDAEDDGQQAAGARGGRRLQLRWRRDNIATLTLDMPERSTRDYAPPPAVGEAAEQQQLSAAASQRRAGRGSGRQR